MTLVKSVLYWLSTVILLLLMGWSAFAYHANHAVMSGFFVKYGYPTYIVYPLAYAKVLAMLIIITHRYNDLRDMAYAAYFVNMCLALTAHRLEGETAVHAIVGMVCIPVSYLLGNQVRGRPVRNLFGRWTD